MSFQLFGWLRPLHSLVYNSAIKHQTCSDWLRQSHVMCSADVSYEMICLAHSWDAHLDQRNFGIRVCDSAGEDQWLSLLHVHHIWDLRLHLYKRPLAIWNAKAEVRNKQTLHTNSRCWQQSRVSNKYTENARLLSNALSLCCFLGCTFAPVAIFLWQWKALGVARPIVRSSGVIKGTGKNLWTF